MLEIAMKKIRRKEVNNMIKMNISLDKGAFLPEKKHPNDAGYDLKAPFDFSIAMNSRMFINTGVHVELPPDTVGMVKSRSGLNKNYRIQCEGVIDENYIEQLELSFIIILMNLLYLKRVIELVNLSFFLVFILN